MKDFNSQKGGREGTTPETTDPEQQEREGKGKKFLLSSNSGKGEGSIFPIKEKGQSSTSSAANRGGKKRESPQLIGNAQQQGNNLGRKKEKEGSLGLRKTHSTNPNLRKKERGLLFYSV